MTSNILRHVQQRNRKQISNDHWCAIDGEGGWVERAREGETKRQR